MTGHFDTTILLIEHGMDLGIKIPDRVVVLDYGENVATSHLTSCAPTQT